LLLYYRSTMVSICWFSHLWSFHRGRIKTILDNFLSSFFSSFLSQIVYFTWIDIYIHTHMILHRSTSRIPSSIPLLLPWWICGERGGGGGEPFLLFGNSFSKNIYSKTLNVFLIFLKCLNTILIFQKYFLILLVETPRYRKHRFFFYVNIILNKIFYELYV